MAYNAGRVAAATPCDRWGAALKAYNAGLGFVLRAQKRSARQATWFGATENINAGQSAKNFEYSRRISAAGLFSSTPHASPNGESESDCSGRQNLIFGELQSWTSPSKMFNCGQDRGRGRLAPCHRSTRCSQGAKVAFAARRQRLVGSSRSLPPSCTPRSPRSRSLLGLKPTTPAAAVVVAVQVAATPAAVEAVAASSDVAAAVAAAPPVAAVTQ